MNQSINMLGTAVRSTRINKQMSQETLAERIGVCKRTIIDIERNTGNPKFEILYPLVRELDLPLYQVFYPESSEISELKERLIQEVSRCSKDEIKIILAIVKSLRSVLKDKEGIFLPEHLKEIDKDI